MKVLPGRFNVNLQIRNYTSALLDVCSHVFEVKQKLPVRVTYHTASIRDIKTISGSLARLRRLLGRAWAPSSPLHGMLKLFDVNCDRLLFLLLKLLHHSHQLPFLLLKVEILFDENVKVLIDLGVRLASDGYQLIFL
jgi:hypothetical protein